MQLTSDPTPSTILTVHDAITDSPVYRSSTLHFDDQLDLLEKWLDSLSKYMKQYSDKLNKFNLETNILCKKVIPMGIDDSMIDPNFTGAVIKSFSDSLQTSLAFKTKLVSDLDDNFIQPLQLFVKTHLKEFKDFRKQHEKSLERYEAQLYKYTSQSKTKEASAVREEAFRLYEARKAYIHMSGQHVVRILHFRSILEHFLVERFTLAATFHLKDFEGGSDSWSKLESNLVSWKRWLLDDKDTCNYQIHQLQSSRLSLESKLLTSIRPARDLDKYAPGQPAAMSSRHSLDYSLTEDQPSHKWGYLFVRGSRNNWVRRWFFLNDGCFGSCNVSISSRTRGNVTLSDRVSVLLCDIKPMPEVDRRFCFEVMCAHQAPFVLQAETEVEMREWMSAFEKAKRLMLQNEQLDFQGRGAPQITATTASETDNSVETGAAASGSPPKESSSVDNISTTAPLQPQKPSIVMLSSSPESDETSLAQSTSLTPLLVWEASRASLNSESTTTTTASPPMSPAQPAQSFASAMNADPATPTAPTSSSWGIPWALVPSMFQTGGEEAEIPPTPNSPHLRSFTDSDGHQVVWPTRMDDANVPKVDLVGYPVGLDTRNKELRHLFGGVGANEVVLSAFIGLLKKKPLNDPSEKKELEVPSSPILVGTESLDPEFNSQLSAVVKDPSSHFGYAYTGRGYITQETFWFYSCVMMTCVNTVAIRLCDIKSIRLIRDPSITNIGTNSNLAMAIDLASSTGNNDAQSPLIFTTLMDDIEVIAEKLKFAVANAKDTDPTPIQIVFDILNNMSGATNKNKAANQTKTIIKSNTDPIKSHSDLTSNSSTVSLPSMSSQSPSTYLDPNVSPVPSRSTDTKKKSKAASKLGPVQPKSGALAAAMMAASVAGGSGFLDARKAVDESRSNALRNKKSKAALQDDTDSATLPSSTSTISGSTETNKNVSEPATDGSNATDPHALPPHIKAPSSPVNCGCTNHLDKLDCEIEVPISAKHLYYLLFSEENSKYMDLWEKKTVENKSKALSMTAWETVDGKKERTLKYIIPVNNSMVKVKEAEVVEKQTIEKKEDYLRYVVLTSTKTAQLPYADAFVPYVKYCITWVDPHHSKLSCYTGVKFLKNILVKGIVTKAAMKGMQENLAVFMPIIKNEVNKIVRKKSGGADSDKSDSVSLKRMGTVKRPSAKTEETMETPAWKATLDTAIEFVQDLLEPLPLFAKAGIAALLFIWFTYSWLRAGTRKSSKGVLDNSLRNQQVISRAVYLRDINEGLLNTEIQPIYAQTDSFRSFLESKASNRSMSTSHQWYSSHHHQFAVDLLFSRERLAMLRHDTLILFQLVNEVDAQLLENEYTNWLMDKRLQCRAPEADYTGLHCDEVKRQLKAFPRYTKLNR